MFDNQSTKANFWLGLFMGMAAISVVAFFALLIAVFSNGQSVALVDEATATGGDTTAPADNTTQPTAGPVPAVTADDHVTGGKSAKVTLIMYTDFECPYCLKHYDVTKELQKKYGDKIKLIVRNYPLSFHAQAEKAAEASECASEQGKFWQMYDALFAANRAKTMSVDQWKTEAKKLGLDTKKFNTCLDTGKYADKVKKQQDGGLSAGVEGTPATFINGKMLSGAMPLESYTAEIDPLLK